MSRFRSFLFLASAGAVLMFVHASCDRDENETSSGSQPTATGSCDTVGCAPTPICPDTCHDACGCCGCGAPGALEYANGTLYECQGSCKAQTDGDGCDVPECFVAIQCVERCGGPIVLVSCCPCPLNTIDVTTCADAGADGG